MISHIGEQSAEVLLFEIRPGSEASVASAVSRQLLAAKCTHVLYKVLGSYDLMAVVGHAGDAEMPTMMGIPGVLRVERMPCFEWVDDSGTGSTCALDFKRLDQPLVALTLLKLKPEVAAMDGASVERPLVEALSGFVSESSDGTSSVLLGGLGWSEVVLLTLGHSFSKVLGAVSGMTSTLVAAQKDGELGGVERLTLKSHTTLAVNRSIPSKRDYQLLKERVGGRSRLQLELHIARYPEFDKSVRRYVQDHELGIPREVFGAYDIAVTMGPGQLGECIAKIVAFREALGDQLIATATEITRRDVGRVALARTEPPQPRALPTDSPLPSVEILQSAARVYPGLEALVLNLFATQRNFSSDPLLQEAVADLAPFVGWFEQLLPRAIEQPEYREDLERALDMYSMGVQQRVAGTLTALGEIQFAPSIFRGGIHRVIAAASVVPRVLLAEAHIEWTGFIVFGAARAYRQDVGGVINLSTEVLYRPEEWWGLFHEVGHNYWYNTPVFQPGGEVSEFAHMQLGEDSADDMKHLSWIVWEALADIYDFVVGFDQDERLYLSTIWRYLTSQSYDFADLLYYFTRSLCVHMYAQIYASGEDVGRASTEFDLHCESEALGELLAESLAESDPHMVERVVTEAATLLMKAWPFIVELAHSYLEGDGLIGAHPGRLDHGVLDDLMAGRIPDGPVDPIVMIRTLAAQGPLSYQARMAAIVALHELSVERPIRSVPLVTHSAEAGA